MISWHAVALHLADRGSACALLDGTRKIQLFSTAFEEALGFSREQVEGRPWDEAIAPEAHADIARSRVNRALSGASRAFETEARTANGGHVKLSLDAALVGRDGEQGILLVVTSICPIAAESSVRLVDEIDYEISASLSDAGRLLAVRTPGAAARTEFGPDARCYAVLHGERAPCPDCPVMRGGSEPWPRTTARRLRTKRPGYEVVTAEPADDRVRMRLRRISDDAITAIYDSRVRDLADSAQLSDRERAVLTYLLMGRSLADIAAILNISPRTVKFHQANILEKLGADSRTDLIRLVT